MYITELPIRSRPISGVNPLKAAVFELNDAETKETHQPTCCLYSQPHVRARLARRRRLLRREDRRIQDIMYPEKHAIEESEMTLTLKRKHINYDRST